MHGQTVAMAAAYAARIVNRFAAVPEHARVLHVEVDGQRLVDLDILAGLDTAAAEDALIRIIGVEGVGVVLLIRLALEFVALDGNLHLRIGVVQRAVAGVVLAQRAIQLVLGDQPIHAFFARRLGFGDLTGDLQPVVRL